MMELIYNSEQQKKSYIWWGCDLAGNFFKVSVSYDLAGNQIEKIEPINFYGYNNAEEGRLTKEEG